MATNNYNVDTARPFSSPEPEDSDDKSFRMVSPKMANWGSPIDRRKKNTFMSFSDDDTYLRQERREIYRGLDLLRDMAGD